MILLVDPDAAAAQSLATVLERLDRVRVAPTSRTAQRMLARHDESWTVLVARTHGGDRSWEELVDEARECNAGIGVLLVDDDGGPALVRRAFAHGVTVTCPPLVAGELTAFVRRHLAAAARGPAAVDGAVARLAARHALRPRELRLLQLAIEGRRRRDIASDLSVSENTVKTQIRMLLRRCGGGKMSDLARVALRLAAVAPPPPISLSLGMGKLPAAETSSRISDAG